MTPQEHPSVHPLYSEYAQQRERSGLCITKAAGGPRYCLYRFADVSAALKDARFGAAPAPESLLRALRWTGFGFLSKIIESGLLIALNPPDHTRMRKIIEPFFSGRMMELMKPRVEETIDALLTRVRIAGRFDLIADVAVPLPTQMIAEIFGFPKDDLPLLKRWSDDLAPLIDSDLQRSSWIRRLKAFLGFRSRVKQLVSLRRQVPKPDLLSALAEAQYGSGDLTENEVVGTAIFVLTAGHATTAHLIGSAIYLLLNHRHEFNRLKEDPSLVDRVVEETLRLESPIQRTGRVLREDIELQGQRIPRGAKIRLMLGSANRDPRQFSNPDHFDPSRAEGRHVGFGGGIHQCIGLHLARLEARLVINALLQRFPNLIADPQELRWVSGTKFRGLSRFLVRAVV